MASNPVGRIEDPVEVNFSFPKTSKVKVEGTDGLGFQDEVTVMVTGRIKSIGERWSEDGIQFTVKPSKVEVLKKAEGSATLTGAMEKARRKVG